MDPISLSLIVLFIGAFSSFLVRRYSGLLSTFTLVIALIMLLIGGMNFYKEYTLFEELDFSFGILLDKLSFPLAFIVLFISTLASYFSIDFMKGGKNVHLYFTSLLLFVTGMYGVLLSTNFIQFYIFWELMILPAYFLIAYWGYENAVRAALVFFIFMHIGAILILAGILWMYAHLGTFNILRLNEKVHLLTQSSIKWLSVLFLIGFGVKMAIFPLHSWLPDAHSEAPAPISAMLSGLMIGMGAYGIARILLPLFGSFLMNYNLWLTVISLLTMFYGAIMALAQNDIKRLLAYSSISQMGYVFFGLFTPGLSYIGSIFQVINHAIVKALLFFISGIIIYTAGTRDMRKLGGLLKDLPLIASCFTIAALALSGIPLLNMFVSEWLIFQGSMMRGKFLSTSFSVALTFLTLTYSVWSLNRIFFGKKMDLKLKPLTLKFKITVLLLALMIIVIGVRPSIVIKFLT